VSLFRVPVPRLLLLPHRLSTRPAVYTCLWRLVTGERRTCREQHRGNRDPSDGGGRQFKHLAPVPMKTFPDLKMNERYFPAVSTPKKNVSICYRPQIAR